MRKLGFFHLFLFFSLTLTSPSFASEKTLEQLPGQIAFVGSDRNIYTLNLFDDELTSLTDDAREDRRYQWPTWAIDGRLAYFCCETVTLDGVVLEVYVSQEGIQLGDLAYEAANEVFYHAYWSPVACSESDDCRDLAILLNNLTEENLNIQIVRNQGSESSDFAIGGGQPFYYSWSPDGTKMLWQQDNRSLSIYEFETNTEQDLAQLPGFIQAPAWSPVDERLLFGAFNPDNQTTDLVIVSGDEMLTLEEGIEGLVSYNWSPDGRYVGYRILSDQRIGSLYVVDSVTGELIANSDIESVYAFFWSPDSQHVAYVALATGSGQADANTMAIPVSEARQDAPDIGWSVLNVADSINRLYGTFAPTSEMVYLFNFFDQFAQSHQIWSPDSTHIVYGEISPEGKPIISILDMMQSDTVPSSVADGYIGIWSYE